MPPTANDVLHSLNFVLTPRRPPRSGSAVLRSQHATVRATLLLASGQAQMHLHRLPVSVTRGTSRPCRRPSGGEVARHVDDEMRRLRVQQADAPAGADLD